MVTMRLGKKDVLLSVVVLCTVFLMTDIVKSDIVIKKQRTKRSLSDEMLRNNYLSQLISKEDEYIEKKRSAISEWIKMIKTRNMPNNSPAKKNTKEELISESETREPISKDYEIISPNVDTYKEYSEDFGIIDEIKESGKLGRFIRPFSSLGRQQKRKKRAPSASTLPNAEVSSSKLTTNTDTLIKSTEENKEASKLETTLGTEKTGLSETTQNSEETTETTGDTKITSGNTKGTEETTGNTEGTGKTTGNIEGTGKTTENKEATGKTTGITEGTGETTGITEGTGKTTGDNLLGSALGAAMQPVLSALKKQGVDLSKGMDLLNSYSVQKDMTATTATSTKKPLSFPTVTVTLPELYPSSLGFRQANFKVKGPSGDTRDPNTFISPVKPYIVPGDLFRAGLDSFRRRNEKTEQNKKIVSKKKMEPGETPAIMRFPVPPLLHRRRIPTKATSATSKILLSTTTVIMNITKPRSDSIGVKKEETERGGEASYVDSFLIVDPNNAGFNRMAYEQYLPGIVNSDEAVFDGMAYYEDTPVFQDPDKRPLLKKSTRDLHFREDGENEYRLNPSGDKTQYEESRSIANTSFLVKEMEFEDSHRRSENITLELGKYSGSDSVGKLNKDKETEEVAPKEDSSLIENPNIARSYEVATEEESSLFEDRNTTRSEKVEIDDYLLIEDPNTTRSYEKATDEDSSEILDTDVGDVIKSEGKSSNNSEGLRHRQNGGIPNTPGRSVIVRVRRKDILLTWSLPKTDDGPPPDGYIVEMKNENGDYKNVGEPRMPYLEINQLRPGEIYFFKIRSRNESGNSSPMIIKYFMDDEIFAVPEVKVEDN